MSGVPAKRAFIDRQMVSFHDYKGAVDWYRTNISLILARKGLKMNPLTVAHLSNFRDVFWHYRKMNELSAKPEKAGAQYDMMLEHLNWAVVDLLVEPLQYIYQLHICLAKQAQKLLQEGVLVKAKEAGYEEIFRNSKEGYLSARRALLMIRSRRSSIYRPISAPEDFDDPAEYSANDDYFFEVLALFVHSFELLMTFRQRGSQSA